MTDRELFFCDSAGAREALRVELRDHPDRVVAEYVTITEDLQVQWRLQEADLDALYRRCKTALERWLKDLRVYVDRLPNMPAMFRTKTERGELELICGMIVSLRDGLDALRELADGLRDAEERMSYYRVQLTDVEQMLSLLREETNGAFQLRVAVLQSDAVRLKSAFADAWSNLQVLCREWLAFVVVTVPDFLKHISVDADLSNNGAHGSVTSVRTRCGELRFAAELLVRRLPLRSRKT